ncbi:hypothetical protein QBC40DRAFT_313491, partial [Triangularia verruculosa]
TLLSPYRIFFSTHSYATRESFIPNSAHSSVGQQSRAHWNLGTVANMATNPKMKVADSHTGPSQSSSKSHSDGNDNADGGGDEQTFTIVGNGDGNETASEAQDTSTGGSHEGDANIENLEDDEEGETGDNEFVEDDCSDDDSSDEEFGPNESWFWAQATDEAFEDQDHPLHLFSCYKCLKGFFYEFRHEGYRRSEFMDPANVELRNEVLAKGQVWRKDIRGFVKELQMKIKAEKAAKERLLDERHVKDKTMENAISSDEGDHETDNFVNGEEGKGLKRGRLEDLEDESNSVKRSRVLRYEYR